jgi:hypothetical protein
MSISEKPSQRTAAYIFSNYGYLLVIAAFLFADFIPRFWQGDSLSYLMTGEDWIPPDRSWAFGFFANYIFRHTRGGSAFILMQVGIMALLIATARVYFPYRRKLGIVYGAIAIVLALDPCLEIYTRFFMSDFLAFTFFFLALLALFRLMSESEDGNHSWFWIGCVVISGMAAIWVRVAYAVIVEVAVLLTALIRMGRLSRRQWLALCLSALAPFLAVASILAANRIVFADRFPHELFVNRLSGVLTAAVFAPAVQKSDFDKVGIPITNAEFQRLDLKNYNKRSDHVWGTAHDDLHQFLRDKLGVKEGEGDTRAVGKASSGLVRSAFLRNPFAVAKVYVYDLLEYATPRRWRVQGPNESGLTRPLPDYFVSFWNRYSALKVDPEITRIRSPLVRIFEATLYFYPFVLLLGAIAAAYLIITERSMPSAVVLTAGSVAVLAAAPLYSDYVLARYVLGAIVNSYLLVGLAVQTIVSRRYAHASDR